MTTTDDLVLGEGQDTLDCFLQVFWEMEKQRMNDWYFVGDFFRQKDNRYYYYSKIGRDYCHLTEEGKNAVINWIDTMAPIMIKLEEEEINLKAKQLVIDELKK